MEKKTVSMTVRLEEDTAAEITKRAEADERSVSFVIRKLILKALESEKRRKGCPQDTKKVAAR